MGSHPAYLGDDFRINLLVGERSVSIFITTSQGYSNFDFLHVLFVIVHAMKTLISRCLEIIVYKLLPFQPST